MGTALPDNVATLLRVPREVSNLNFALTEPPKTSLCPPFRLIWKGAARAEGSPSQSHISLSILVYEDQHSCFGTSIDWYGLLNGRFSGLGTALPENVATLLRVPRVTTLLCFPREDLPSSASQGRYYLSFVSEDRYYPPPRPERGTTNLVQRSRTALPPSSGS